MKKIISQYNAQLNSAIVITILIVAMISDGNNSLLFKWITLGLLWGIALNYLKNPKTYYSISKDKVFIAYLFFVAWAIFPAFFYQRQNQSALLALCLLLAAH